LARRAAFRSNSTAARTGTTPPTAKPEEHWKYEVSVNKMDSSITNTAWINSNNTFELDFPYRGEQTATIMLRKEKRTGNDIMFIVNKGQINSGIDGGSILVRFDDKPPQLFRTSQPSDHSSNVVFIKDTTKFIRFLKSSRTMLVEVEFFNNGTRTLEFNTSNITWN